MLSIMTDHFKVVLSTQSNYFLPLKDHFLYFLFGGGSLRKSQERSLCSILKMLVSKYSYGQWLIRINIKKIIWGGCEGLSPLKPQSHLATARGGDNLMILKGPPKNDQKQQKLFPIYFFQFYFRNLDGYWPLKRPFWGRIGVLGG